MRTILIVTDAYYPQVNGVVRTLVKIAQILQKKNYSVKFLEPSTFPTFPMPTYKEIRLSIALPGVVRNKIEEIDPDAIHIATEGPLGAMARRYCIKKNIAFSTSFHTQYPEYLRARAPVPLKWSYAYFRRFHSAAKYCLVSSRTVAKRLQEKGFRNIVDWSLGVDSKIFSPSFRDENSAEFNFPRPIFLYVGRVAIEKNIEDFLKLDLQGTKMVVGSGPQLEQLKKQYQNCVFVGPKKGAELSRYYASADCFVFPSKTDTFGLVLLEAMASGLPVAAYPVQGPLDVIADSGAGILDENLQIAAKRAVKIAREKCVQHAKKFSWERSAQIFLDNLPFIRK